RLRVALGTGMARGEITAGRRKVGILRRRPALGGEGARNARGGSGENDAGGPPPEGQNGHGSLVSMDEAHVEPPPPRSNCRMAGLPAARKDASAQPQTACGRGEEAVDGHKGKSAATRTTEDGQQRTDRRNMRFRPLSSVFCRPILTYSDSSGRRPPRAAPN